jgi:predicted nucleic acid-binding protein
MRLAVDASTLVAEALRARGRQLIAHPALDLVIAVEAWNEAQHELEKRIAAIVDRRLPVISAAELRDAALGTVDAFITLIPGDVYEAQMEEARQRVPRDQRDAPTVALALALAIGIWTADRDFFGCGLPVWTTDILLRSLAPTEER